MSDNFYNSENGVNLGNVVTLSTTFTGAFNLAVDIRYAKIGDQVTVMWPNAAQTALSPSSISTAAPLPVGFRPLVDISYVIRVNNNASIQVGLFQISSSTGNMFWYGDISAGNFTGPGGSNLYADSVTFFVV